MEIEDDEILQSFIEESREHLAGIETDLLAIEETGAVIDEELVNKVFRAAHSIKGSAGFMELTTIQELSHATENVLGLIRSKKLIPAPEVINVLLLAFDQLQRLIEDIQHSNDADIAAHIASLNAISGSANQTDATTEKASDAEQAAARAVSPDAIKTDVQPEEESRQSLRDETSIRVRVNLLDELMTLAGELVLARNQLLQTVHSGDFGNAEAASQRIDLITSRLHETIMLTRMQPIGSIFNKFPRLVRDLAKKLGKTIEMVIAGQNVELDKSILEAINDPLTHLVRNAVDHGIETPVERRRLGKVEAGQITLKAWHEAGQVLIEITDDGQGLDGDALAASAAGKGLITGEQLARMSAKEKIDLIFLPGFSMARRVSDLSGRGVGMDVVKTNLGQLGGHVDIFSEVGQGTTISIKLPLTLAIIPCQMIRCGGERYAIPQANLEELLRIPAAQVKDRIERIGSAEVVRRRDTLLPLVRLSNILGLPPIWWDNQEFKEDRHYRTASVLNIAVVSTGTMQYGLIIDQLHDIEEIVVKPLGQHLLRCQGYAGATIMGDGRVALILDIAGLARMAQLTSLDGSDRAAELARAAEEASRAEKDKQTLVIFRSAESERFAVPLNRVERIDKIERGAIKEAGGKRVMQYRDSSLPLVRVDDVAMVQPLADREDLLVIIFNIAGHAIGLLAIGPINIVEISGGIDEVTLRQNGIAGSAIIGRETTLIVDIFEMAWQLFPQWFEARGEAEIKESP